MSAIATFRARQRYDAFTLTLHWLTAASVIFLFASAHIWELLDIAWALIVLALAHAIAALFHHYFLCDNVLRRMLPQAARRA